MATPDPNISSYDQFFQNPKTAPIQGGQQLITDEEQAWAQRQGGDSGAYGSNYFGLSGYKIPSGISNTSLQQAVSWAEAFASFSGWGSYPSADAIVRVARGGGSKIDAFHAFQASVNPSWASSHPWAGWGLTEDDYHQKMSQLGDSLFTLLGVSDFGAAGVDQGLIGHYMEGTYNDADLSQMLTNDPSMQAKYGWLKYNKTFTDMQNYVNQNKTQLEQRFGKGKANIANATTDVGNPLASAPMTGSSVTADTGQKYAVMTPQAGRI